MQSSQAPWPCRGIDLPGPSRAYRLRRNDWAQGGVQAGVTNSTISLIERETHSLASLHRLRSAVPIAMADFLALPTSQKNVMFFDRSDLAAVARGETDLRVLAAERRDKTRQRFIDRYQPGAGIGHATSTVHGRRSPVPLQSRGFSCGRAPGPFGRAIGVSAGRWSRRGRSGSANWHCRRRKRPSSHRRGC